MENSKVTGHFNQITNLLSQFLIKISCLFNQFLTFFVTRTLNVKISIWWPKFADFFFLALNSAGKTKSCRSKCYPGICCRWHYCCWGSYLWNPYPCVHVTTNIISSVYISIIELLINKYVLTVHRIPWRFILEGVRVRERNKEHKLIKLDKIFGLSWKMWWLFCRLIVFARYGKLRKQYLRVGDLI